MTTRQDDRREPDDFEREVARYLRDHPDFFERHPELLADMVLPHDTGQAVSLIERQVAVLRDQRDTQRRQLQQLIQTAQQNEQLNNHVNALVLALLDAGSLEEVLNIVHTRLATDFDAEAVVVRLFRTDHPAMANLPQLADWSEPVLGAFEKVIQNRRPVCGTLRPGQLDALFSDVADDIASAALVPLVESANSRKCYGLLAIGSQDRNRFRADMGTVFLSQLGKILSRVLRRHLDRPAHA